VEKLDLKLTDMREFSGHSDDLMSSSGSEDPFFESTESHNLGRRQSPNCYQDLVTFVRCFSDLTGILENWGIAIELSEIS
jgi:hypothetical protein